VQELVIHGGRALRGTITASGSKNAALPIMAASILVKGTTILRRVPRLTDVETMIAILRALGMEARWVGQDSLMLRSRGADITVAPREWVRSMRASICVLGPLVVSRGAATLPLPGGCVIGERPIDLHLKGLRTLGAEIYQDTHQIYARASALKGGRVKLGGPRGSTCLGTANIMAAATLAQGETVIEFAAKEPEIQDVARYLVACGAQIHGIGSSTLRIRGTDRLEGCEYSLIPDRIEVGTYLAAAAATGGDVCVEECRPDHMAATIEAIERMGVQIDVGRNTLRARRAGDLRAIQFSTAPYPGLPTDMQPQLSALLCLARGAGAVRESVYPERFTHVRGLQRMGARITRRGHLAVVQGVRKMEGTRVGATDLRAGAALVVAALAAQGRTVISKVAQIDRGYQHIEKRLGKLGARIRRREARWAGSRRSA